MNLFIQIISRFIGVTILVGILTLCCYAWRLMFAYWGNLLGN